MSYSKINNGFVQVENSIYQLVNFFKQLASVKLL